MIVSYVTTANESVGEGFPLPPFVPNAPQSAVYKRIAFLPCHSEWSKAESNCKAAPSLCEAESRKEFCQDDGADRCVLPRLVADNGLSRAPTPTGLCVVLRLVADNGLSRAPTPTVRAVFRGL